MKPNMLSRASAKVLSYQPDITLSDEVTTPIAAVTQCRETV